jgi:hypothetical protein
MGLSPIGASPRRFPRFMLVPSMTPLSAAMRLLEEEVEHGGRLPASKAV